MNVVPYKAEHLLKLQLQKGQVHSGAFISEDYAKQLESAYSFTALVNGEPVMVGGIWKLWENRAVVWSFVDRSAGPHFPSLHKAVKKVLDSAPFPRLEADTPCDFEEGHRWLRMLGFAMEAERMRGYRPDGGDSSLYARVK
jgi:hypothetical protein